MADITNIDFTYGINECTMIKAIIGNYANRRIYKW
jgi:hypothetical protein